MVVIVINISHLCEVGSLVESKEMNQEANSHNDEPEKEETDDDATSHPLGVPTSDGTNVKFSEYEEGLLFARVLENTNQCCQYDTEEDE